jgi:hypothetical protein
MERHSASGQLLAAFTRLRVRSPDSRPLRGGRRFGERRGAPPCAPPRRRRRRCRLVRLAQIDGRGGGDVDAQTLSHDLQLAVLGHGWLELLQAMCDALLGGAQVIENGPGELLVEIGCAALHHGRCAQRALSGDSARSLASNEFGVAGRRQLASVQSRRGVPTSQPCIIDLSTADLTLGAKGPEHSRDRRRRRRARDAD